MLQCLVDGPEEVLKRSFYRSFGSKLGIPPPPSLFGKNEKEKSRENYIHIGKGRKGPSKKKETEKKEKDKDEGDEITLTQMSKRYPIREEEEDKPNHMKSTKESETSQEKGLSIHIHSLKVMQKIFFVMTFNISQFFIRKEFFTFTLVSL